jgi:transcriptional regulator with XRE-family HTH domain
MGIAAGRRTPNGHLPPARPLGAELRRIRLARGLSQREVVRRLGLSAHSNLVDYELGRRIPPGDIVAACEMLFDVPRGSLERLRCAALAERAARRCPITAQPEPDSLDPSLPGQPRPPFRAERSRLFPTAVA